jgi:hypothetical protein
MPPPSSYVVMSSILTAPARFEDRLSSLSSTKAMYLALILLGVYIFLIIVAMSER